MKNYKKYKPETINTVELPSPEAVADILAAEILTHINENGRVISRRILRKSIINGLAKLALVTIAADDDTNDTRAEYKGKITLRKSRSNGKPTEYQKLKAAIKNGGIYPEIFCVSCIVGGKVKSCAVVRTSDLMKFISETNPPTFTNYDRDKHQRQDYFCFDLSQMKQKGYRVWILSSCA